MPLFVIIASIIFDFTAFEPVSYTHLDVYKRQVKYRPRKWRSYAVLKGILKLTVSNEAIREDLQVFNFNENIKDYKQRWK